MQEVLVSSQHSYPTLIDWEHLGDVEEPRVKTMSPYEWIEVENKLKHLCDAFVVVFLYPVMCDCFFSPDMIVFLRSIRIGVIAYNKKCCHV